MDKYNDNPKYLTCIANQQVVKRRCTSVCNHINHFKWDILSGSEETAEKKQDKRGKRNSSYFKATTLQGDPPVTSPNRQGIIGRKTPFNETQTHSSSERQQDNHERGCRNRNHSSLSLSANSVTGDRPTFKNIHHVEEGQRQRGLPAARATTDSHLEEESWSWHCGETSHTCVTTEWRLRAECGWSLLTRCQFTVYWRHMDVISKETCHF